MEHDLFYQQGLSNAWVRGVNAQGFPSGHTIQFPTSAIEVKGDWALIDPVNPTLTTNNCHWNYDENGNLWGLIGFHIMTKALPNWTWATFEWVDNPSASWKAIGAVGRSDWIGTRDDFGFSYTNKQGKYTSFQAPVFANGDTNTPSGQSYPGGRMSPELEALFLEKGYPGEWYSEWKNYRLKGSQVDFTDATGASTYLGNSSTEAALISQHVLTNGNLTMSSCITCHAAANTAGAAPVPMAPASRTRPSSLGP